MCLITALKGIFRQTEPLEGPAGLIIPGVFARTISIKYQIYTGQTDLKVRSGTNFTTSVVVAFLVLFLSIGVLIKQRAREKE